MADIPQEPEKYCKLEITDKLEGYEETISVVIDIKIYGCEVFSFTTNDIYECREEYMECCNRSECIKAYFNNMVSIYGHVDELVYNVRKTVSEVEIFPGLSGITKLTIKEGCGIQLIDTCEDLKYLNIEDQCAGGEVIIHEQPSLEELKANSCVETDGMISSCIRKFDVLSWDCGYW